ncbi:hypothetical protein NIASO_16995 [Niabella soli DSM 19437]|uniref:Uncharacterized protein n=1 Tax=Niabella soli DSM 19437 TaxID=929713 RepID=W0F8X9_9BACT|nr:hypothetical protein NIASO_16995 [Niabella soli DSM 19437]
MQAVAPAHIVLLQKSAEAPAVHNKTTMLHYAHLLAITRRFTRQNRSFAPFLPQSATKRLTSADSDTIFELLKQSTHLTYKI